MSGAPLLSVELFENIPQWCLERMQLINWGTFHSYRCVDFAPTTLISGPSGSGKSTLLDAYTALMMDSNTPYNGASNEGKGRARGKDQRSTLSYIRGTVDTVRDPETGELVDEVLRGKDTATWSAIAATFRNDDGRTFTAVRLYHASAGASSTADLTMRMLTMDGSLYLNEVEEFVAGKFLPRMLIGRYPTMRNHDSYLTFSQALYTKLGIGQNGDGARAMKLLARIQGGHHVKSVDALYKQLVLERPETYERADVVISHFDDLAQTHAAMQTAAQKVEVLKPIPSMHEEMSSAQQECEAIDTFRVHAEGPTPFLLGKLYTERSLLDDTVDANRGAYKTVAETLRTAGAEERRLKLQLEQNRADQRANGGEALERLDERLSILANEREEVANELLRFTERIQPLGRPTPQDQEEFETLTREAQQFASSYEDQDGDLTRRLDKVKRQAWKRHDAREELAGEYESLKGRTTNLPRRYLEARLKMAARAGMDPADMPFVAELIDILPEHKQWRQATELVMGGLATTMLVNRDVEVQFRRSIDGMPLSDRVRFEAVPTGMSGAAAAAGTLAATLDFADSPFRGWVQQEVTRRFDHKRVESAHDFNHDSTRQVTLAGQVKDGHRGAHGGKTGEPLIGFSNEAHRQEVGRRLEELDSELAALKKNGDELVQQAQSLRRRHEAYRDILSTSWQKIDVASTDAQINKTNAEKDRVRGANSTLAGLEKEWQRLDKEHREANRQRVNAETEAERLNTEHGPLVDRQDEVNLAIEGAEKRAVLTDSQQVTLNEAFAEYGVPGDLARLEESFAKVKRHLAASAEEARGREVKAAGDLKRVFEQYQRLWPEADLGTSVESYLGYRIILDGLVADGLPERQDEFKREMAQWSGRDLVTLSYAMREAVNRIEERLDAVNAILANIPFGRERDRLRITLRRLPSQQVRIFLQRLRRIAEGATTMYTDAEIDVRFKEIASFINLIRTSDTLPKGVTYTRDNHLDVHRHIAITAERIDEDGNQLSVYDSLGGKSGGETQELVAFIVGAALRYQLGDEESSTRPRFAPVLLDEGFIKADAEFAGRAVGAWKRLGFQLIIGAPLDKVSGIETHVDLILGVNKPSKFTLIHPVRPTTSPAPGTATPPSMETA
jgi:uncharacterized protein YPO0396